MAGIDDDIENEGAIDTGDDTMQAAQSASPSPPISDGDQPTQATSNPPPNQLPNMGPPPLAQGAAQESMGAGLQKTGQAISRDVGQGIENFKQSGPAQIAKRIASYLMGSHAENPAALDQAGAQVDPQGQMSPGDRNLIAIDKAAETGGQDAAWKLLQANRVAFNAKQAFARAALHGVQGKPADINAAIDAANQAEQHIPDGSNVKFARSQNGVTATVTMPGTSQPQQIPLTTEQFDKWLDVGGDGQWDKVHQASVPATLQRLSQASGPAYDPASRAARPAQSAPSQAPQRQTSYGKTPSSMDLAGGEAARPDQPDQTNYGDELEARAMRMFPSASQQAQRDQWMAAQEARSEEMQNKVDVAKETGENRVRAARETGLGRERAAQAGGNARIEAAKLYSGAKRDTAMAANALKIKQLEQSGANKQEEGQRKLIQTYLMTGQPVPPHLQKYIDQGTDSALATQAGQPQQRAPAPAAQPASPNRAQFADGKFYIKGPDGKAKLDPNQNP